MQTRPSTGFFGKLPAHGDFIHRGLPTHCINVWDEWLQSVVGASQEQLGEQWLDVYLTSPIWRFAFSPGVIDEHIWAGISLPSVDRVGRYFPFSILSCAPASVPATALLSDNNPWFEAIEQAALEALDGQLLIDGLAERLQAVPLATTSRYRRGRPEQGGERSVIALEDEARGPESVYPYFLDSCLLATRPCYSLWSTAGSDRVEPCVATASGLPPVASAAAMLTGQWRDWQWDQPYQARREME